LFVLDLMTERNIAIRAVGTGGLSRLALTSNVRSLS